MSLRVHELVAFAKERHNIWLARDAGKPKPWTKDDILRKYRFCNVYRELDTVTIWIRENWRDPNTRDPNLFFNMTIARLINWPDTLAELGYTKQFDSKRFAAIVNGREGKAYSGAYIVSTNGNRMNKAEYLAMRVLAPLWLNRGEMAPMKGETLQSYHKRLMKYDGLGSFIAAQVVCDVKYATGSPLYKALDWHTWAASGPGSRRGLNRVAGRPVDAPWPEPVWWAQLGELQKAVAKLWPSKWEPLHAQDLQNCLCEFDKYERTRLGEGRPRSTYPGLR